MSSNQKYSDFTIDKDIATYLIHSKVNLFLNFPRSQLHRLQLFLNSAARAIFKTPRFTCSLYWLKIDQRIHYKILLGPNHLQNTPISQARISPQCSPYQIKHLHSFFYHCLSQTPLSFLSTENNRHVIYSSCTCSLNALPKEFRQPAIHSSHANQFGSTHLLLDLSIGSTSQFNSKLKTHLFHQSLPP